MKSLPAIPVKGAPGFLLWLRRDQPAVYSVLRTQVPEVQLFESALGEARLGGLFDSIAGVLSKVGGAVKIALPKIVAAVPKIAPTILEAGGAVVAAKQQAKVIDMQLKLAQANQAPLTTAQVVSPDGQVQYLQTPAGMQPLVAPRAMLIPGVPDALAYVGGTLLVIMLLRFVSR